MMLDALPPASDAFKQAVAGCASTLEAWQQAVAVTLEAMKNTILLVAKKRRLSYLGDRSINHFDPSTTSTYLIFKTLLET